MNTMGLLERHVLRLTWREVGGALGAALWLYWTMVVAQLPQLGFRFSVNQQAWLLALPALTLTGTRVLAAVLPSAVAGSEWPLWAGALLLPLAVGIGTAASLPHTSYETLVMLALLSGVGLALFFAAIVPAGVPLVQQAGALRRKATWWVACTMLASLGTLIGFGASFALLAAPLCPQALPLGWLGPLAAALLLPLGLRLAKPGAAARNTLLGLAGALVALLALWAALALATADSLARGLLFVVGSALLFVSTGLASGAGLAIAERVLPSGEHAAAQSLATAVATLGGFFWPKAIGTAWALAGSPAPALALLAGGVFSCALLTWWQFARRYAALPC